METWGQDLAACREAHWSKAGKSEVGTICLQLAFDPGPKGHIP